MLTRSLLRFINLVITEIFLVFHFDVKGKERFRKREKDTQMEVLSSSTSLCAKMWPPGMSSHKKWSSKGKGAEELEDIRKEQKVAFLLHLSYLLLTVFITFSSFFFHYYYPCVSQQCRFQKKWQNNTKTEKTFLIEKADFSWWWKCRFFSLHYINLYVLTQSIKSVCLSDVSPTELREIG